MDQKSELQLRYSLSSRKFWKKLIEKLASMVVVSGFFIVFPASIFFLTKVHSKFNGQTTNPWYPVFFFGFIWGLVLLFFLILYAWYIKAYIRRYYYDAGPDFVTIKKGVFTPAEIHVQYGKIQDVYVDQDLVDRILGLCDVHIASATITSGIEAHIDGVGKVAADGLKNFLLSKISNQVSPPVNTPNQPIAPQPRVTFQSNEEVSSHSYPISSKWIPARFFSGFTWTVMVYLFFAIAIKFNFWPSLVLAIIFVGLFVWRLIYLAIWKKNFQFSFTSNFITTHSSVVSRFEKQLPYSSIQDVTVRQGLFDRLFGICNVFITNASAGNFGIVLPGQTLKNGNKISVIVKNLILRSDHSQTGL